MRKSNITASIMQKVVFFEKRRSLAYLGQLAFIVLAFGLAAAFFLWVVINELIDTGSFSVLSILASDQEMLKEFWQDILGLFWETLPKLETLAGISLLAIIVTILIFSRKRVEIVRRRLANTIKYQNRK